MNASGSPRFTLDGSPELEAHLASVCDQVRAGVARILTGGTLRGLLLGGGYGRGEGGVLRTPEGDRPYNDLEFYVFARGPALLAERKYRGPLHHLGESLSTGAGLEVEFKVLTLAKLRGSGPTMFYYDLVCGHRWLVGDDSLLRGCEGHRNGALIPAHEATRLLLNRCSGLLFSLERLRRATFGPGEADFVGRNLAKAQLALGDAILATRGQYHWSCRERHRRLVESRPVGDLPMPELVRHHAEGVEFKLHPGRSTASREELATRHAHLTDLARQVWLWVEGRRLQGAFNTPRRYAESPYSKCPEVPPTRCRLVNLRTFGLATALGARGTRYPRERLMHALCLLLWPDAHLAESGLLARAAGELQTGAEDFPGIVAAYERLWRQFN